MLLQYKLPSWLPLTRTLILSTLFTSSLVCVGTQLYIVPLPTSHVQINNEDALQFYQKFDFHSVETKEQYYKRIDPPHAHVLQKDMKSPVSPTTSYETDTNAID